MPHQSSDPTASAAFLAVLEPYQRAFVEPSAALRLQLLQRSLTPNAEIWGPSRVYAGYDEIVQKIEGFARNWAGCRLVVAGELVVFKSLAHFAMAIVNTEGRSLATGHSVVELAEDGRIRRVLAFWRQSNAQELSHDSGNAA